MIYYNLKGKVHNGYIFEKFTKGMYWLLQAGSIAHDDLIQNLSPYGYHATKNTPWL